VALLVQGVLCTVFIVAGLVGATVRDAYVALTSTTIILFFVPYLYIFAAYLRLRRERTPRTALVGWVGMAAVALSIALSLVPPAVEQPLVFEAKVLGGTVIFLGIGLALSRRSVRAGTAAGGGLT
jgi:amino acid transporter